MDGLHWQEFSWLGMLIAAIMAYGASWVWYGPVFGKAIAAFQDTPPKSMAQVMVLDALGVILLAILVAILIEAHFYDNAVINTLFAISFSGATIAVGMATGTAATNASWAQWRLTAGAEAIVKPLVVALAYMGFA